MRVLGIIISHGLVSLAGIRPLSIPAVVAASEMLGPVVPAFDLPHINEQWGSPADDIYLTVLGVFADEGTKLCAKMLVSAATGRHDELVNAAHTLMGGSANVGALHLAACAKALLVSAETGRDTDLEPLVAQVE